MNTIRKIFDNPVLRAILKVLKNMYFLATVLFLVVVLFVDTNNFFTLIKSKREVRAQEREKIYYKRAIKEAEENLMELSSNRDSLEKFAREQYLFHEDDEDVFVVKR